VDLRQLKTFRVVAATLSITQSAAALGYAQSSVTAQIQGLEANLGVPLFDRLGKRLVLTEAGERLLRYADRLLALGRAPDRGRHTNGLAQRQMVIPCLAGFYGRGSPGTMTSSTRARLAPAPRSLHCSDSMPCWRPRPAPPERLTGRTRWATPSAGSISARTRWPGHLRARPGGPF
jgi:DNA-binding transcriptional LysR family regulator